MSLLDNIPTEYLLARNWEQLEDDDKIRLLTTFEFNVAKAQNRKVRELLYEPKDGEDYAEYFYSDPEHIHLYKLDNPIGSLLSVIHEGTHALLDDARLGITPQINLISSVDKDDLSQMISARDIIHGCLIDEYGPEGLALFQLCYLEEQIPYYESFIHLLNAMLAIPDNDELKKEIRDGVLLVALHYYTGCQEIVSRTGPYDDVEGLLPFEEYPDDFLEVKDFRIGHFEMEPLEDYFNNTINQLMNRDETTGKIETRPKYSPMTVAMIIAAKRGEAEFFIEPSDDEGQFPEQE